jgi:hypothetical protein
MLTRATSAPLAAAALALLLSVMFVAPASAHVLAGAGARLDAGTAAAVSDGPVSIHGTIDWTSTFLNDGAPGDFGSEVQTGTFTVDVVSTVPGPIIGQLWTNAVSSYKVTDTRDDGSTADGCTITTKGHTSGSGSLVDNSPPNHRHSLFAGWGPPYYPWAGFNIWVNANEEQTYTESGPHCSYTNTQTVDLNFLPGCANNVIGEGTGAISGMFKGKNDDGTISISCSQKVPAPGAGTYILKADGKLTVTSSPPCAPPRELSGAAWAGRFKDSHSLDTLKSPFMQDATDFVKAMQKAKISVGIESTLRPPERAYMMHYSWLIAMRDISPARVPAFVPGPGQSPVNICWLHTNAKGGADLPASIAAAQQMVAAFHINSKLAVPPALNSMHTKGLAVDMTTTWPKGSNITIDDSDGNPVHITSGPHDGLNPTLITVGASYDVIHFRPAYDDPDHWSSNGT